MSEPKPLTEERCRELFGPGLDGSPAEEGYREVLDVIRALGQLGEKLKAALLADADTKAALSKAEALNAELLEALEELVVYLPRTVDEEQARNKARAAILKAKGEKP